MWGDGGAHGRRGRVFRDRARSTDNESARAKVKKPAKKAATKKALLT
jgi:hypothetical protein